VTLAAEQLDAATDAIISCTVKEAPTPYLPKCCGAPGTCGNSYPKAGPYTPEHAARLNDAYSAQRRAYAEGA
jgi:hypothetical protein